MTHASNVGWVLPVSYTHLDVYKRQLDGWAAAAVTCLSEHEARSEKSPNNICIHIRIHARALRTERQFLYLTDSGFQSAVTKHVIVDVCLHQIWKDNVLKKGALFSPICK